MIMICGIDQIDTSGKTVFLRVDFNVPLADSKITEPHRIESTLPTIRLILEKSKKVIIASHLGRPSGRKDPRFSLAPIRAYLEQRLGETVVLAPDSIGSEVEKLARDPNSRVVLLENLRFHAEEENNDPLFSRALASLADIYVNDAFGAAHRAHASTAGMAAFFEVKAAGLLLQRELDYLSRVLITPEKPFTAILGGAKVSDKIGVIKNLLPKLDVLLIGGGLAYTFLKANGVDIGRSLVEQDKIPVAKELMANANTNGVKMLLPTDHMTGDEHKKNPSRSDVNIAEGRMGLDIGPQTIRQFIEEIGRSRMVLWNGPVGLFEVKPFDQGSKALAQSLADRRSDIVSIIAGGDTVAAVTAAGVADHITHLSTGGGATLEFLEGRELPGIKALEKSA
jgi:phosphoglycerate kinase